MSPIDKIRKGIVENDMRQIIKGFEQLTGENIKPVVSSNLEVQNEEVVNVSATISEPVRSKDLDFSTTGEPDKSKREPVRAKNNQFIDDGTEALVSEDPELKTPDITLTERRPPANLVEVVCHVCGATEQINKKYKVGQFHRCGKCVG